MAPRTLLFQLETRGVYVRSYRSPLTSCFAICHAMVVAWLPLSKCGCGKSVLRASHGGMHAVLLPGFPMLRIRPGRAHGASEPCDFASTKCAPSDDDCARPRQGERRLSSA